MPTYEYECDLCRFRFEQFQSITAAPLTECPKCKGHVRRLIGTGAGIIFKGSGFYQTDYRSESYKKRATEDSSKGGSEKASTPSATKASDKTANSASDSKGTK